MAIILVEGFDHYSNAQAVDKFWNGLIFAMVPGRGFGGQAIDVIANNTVSKQLPASYSTIIACAALKISGLFPPTQLMLLQASGAPVAILGIDGSQRLTLTGAAANLVATGTTIIPFNRWIYVEMKIVVGTSGTGEVHLNGSPEIASTTSNFGTSSINQVAFKTQLQGGDTFVDDVVIMDSSGSAPQNDFLGDIRVETLYPAADGGYTSWTPKIAGPHYQMVNEHLMDEDGTFVYDSTPNDKDSYKVSTFIGTIYGAQLNLGARKGDASVRQIAPLIKQGGVDYLGSTITLSQDYVIYSWQLSKDPTGADWLAATINADEFGQKLIA